MCRAAAAAGEELEHARTTIAALTRLAVHAPADALLLICSKRRAAGIHAYPKAGQPAEEIVDTAGQEAGCVTFLTRHTAERHQHGHRTCCHVMLRAEEKLRTQIGNGPRGFHRRVD